MKTDASSAVRFWLILGISCGLLASSASAEERRTTHERMTFVNFSDKPVDLYWVDNSVPDGRRELVYAVKPFESYIAKTFSGHEFAYDWGGASYGTVVKGTTTFDAETTEYDPYKIPPQVHVLGNVDEKKVVCGTSNGDIHITVKPFWSPLGAARFLHLLTEEYRYFDGCALNRVVPKFLTQFGIGADFNQRSHFRRANIADDPVHSPRIPFQPGYMSYAGSGPDSRSTEVFIVMPNTPRHQLEYFGTNSWETPFGYVDPTDVHTVVGKWNSYGDMEPYGNGPDPQKIYMEDGYEYLERDFPELEYIEGCAIIPDADANDSAVTGLSYDELAEYVFNTEGEEL
mmetsp:Transcript_5801/g.14483  ORF Transcript_5801/g.14483 Transcript_5801/m.14483 type:complete len:343 (+) Transcript_5801:99-1127(+)|eukprot:CAMPEP_0197175190 /NCGR_PEP_ID=MMETSP1423-20130617/1470_1 /TAXON_ID=476441 /ORGANISM="Pseudo-nitzschia heimii, Strain UNC1101" /LENGTH=342 /DNA_ID=CAMNT_0042624281 /DNA_START=9 /DNA_END=1037 /DNA_ORIENTATION=-